MTFKVVDDPETGVWHQSGWCSQHRELGRAASWRESHREGRERDATPHPNRGGLLPSYLGLNGTGTWVELYLSAVFHDWEPPAVGVVADDWDVLGKVYAPARPRPKLTLIVGEGIA